MSSPINNSQFNAFEVEYESQSSFSSLDTPLFDSEDGALTNPLQSIFNFKDAQTSAVGKSGARAVTLLACVGASILSLAESIIFLALSILTSPLALCSKGDQLNEQLLERAEGSAGLSGALMGMGFRQLFCKEKIDSTPALDAPLFDGEDGVLGKPLQSLLEFRDSQTSVAGKLGARAVALLACVGASILSLAESITFLALSILTSPLTVCSKGDKLNERLLERASKSAALSAILLGGGFRQLFSKDSL